MLTPGYGRRPLRYGSAQSEWEVRDLGYYIAPNDYWDATAAVDLRQRSGWLGRLQLNYALRYRFKGSVNAVGKSTERVCCSKELASSILITVSKWERMPTCAPLALSRATNALA